MATTSRDAKLVLNVEALGQENISKLEKQLRDLAATGGASSAEFADLADQIGRLGSQSDALQAIKSLSEDTEVLRAKQEAAAAAAQDLSVKLSTLKQATNETKVSQEAARATLVAGEQAYVQVGNALRLLKTEYDAAGRQTDEYRNRLQALVVEQNDARLALVGLRDANRQATAAVTEANAEQRKVESAYKSANAGYDRATTALDEQTKALRVASSAAEQLGVNAGDLAAAEAELVTTFVNASSAAKTRAAAIDEMVAADRLAAIEAKGMADLYARGASALQAETLGLRDAARVTAEYAAAKAKATADAEAWQREADSIVSLKEAEQQTLRTTSDLVGKLAELRNVHAFEQQAAEAQKLVQSAEYVRFWEQALDAADRKQAELAAGTERLTAAFAQINVRPVEAIRQEISATNTAMQTLASSGKLTGGALAVAMEQGQAKVAQLEREMRQLTGTMTLADHAADMLKNSMGQIAAGNIIADGVGYLVNKVKEMGREFVATTVETETLRRGLNAVYKDAKIAADQFNFLNKTAQASGIAVGSLGESFVQFNAATKSANIPLAVTNDLFATITRVSGSLGLSAESTGGALSALGQIASKGVVALEELRQQLGDRLPGALSAAAKGLGLTDAELIKLVESGSLAARDFFPAFSQGLKTLQGDTEGLLPTWNRLKNSFTITTQALGDAGVVEVMTAALRGLAAVAALVAIPMLAVADSLFTIVRAGGVLVGAIAAWSNPIQALNELFKAKADRLNAVAKAFGDVVFGADKAKTETITLTAATAAAATAAQQAGAAWGGLSRSQQAAAVAAVIASDAHKDLGAKLVQTNAYIDQALSAQGKETESLAKLAKAVQAQGSALSDLARLRGDEVGALTASEKAAADYAASLDKVAVSHTEETRLLEQKLVKLEETRKAQGDNTEVIAKQTAEIKKKIQVSKAEQEQSESSAKAAHAEALARQLAAESYKDNSAKVEEYRLQLARTNEILAITNQLEKVGAVGKKEVEAATEAVTKATVLYRDAIKDAAANTQLEMETRKAGLTIAKESLSSEVELLKAKAEQARNSGYLVTALDLEREAKRKQLEIDKLLLDIKEVELQLLRAELQSRRDLLLLNEPENALKLKELDLRIKLTDVQEKQLASGRELLKIKTDELNRTEMLPRAIDTETASRGRVSSATNTQSDAIEKLNMRYENSVHYSERQIALLEREAAAAERAAEAYRKKWNIDKDGFTLDANGQRQQQSMPTERYVYDTAKSQGLSEKEALALVAEFIRNGVPANAKPGVLGPSKDWFTRVNEAINKLVMDNARRKANEPTGGDTKTPPGGDVPKTSSTSDTTPTPSAGAPAARQSGVKTVNINIGGRITGIDTASSTDANRLVGVLRQLETESMRSA